MVEESKILRWMPTAVALLAGLTLGLWLSRGPESQLALRVPGTDIPPGMEAAVAVGNPVLLGKLTKGDGQPSDMPGAWPGFRGANHDGISTENQLSRTWPAAGPRELWALDVGEGYAGPAIHRGRVYLMDYDASKKQDARRCLSFADGKEIWRFSYPIRVKRNHGMSRTTPTVTDKYIVAMSPKCHVVCLDTASGELKWGLDLIGDFGATEPQWYAGQCPLVENGLAIIAPGGKDALLMAVDCETGKPVWKTPNPKKWLMTHSSITPMEFGGQRIYVYCGSRGVVGVSAKDGALLWETTDWKISIANVPSPLVLENGKIFLSGGYDAGSMMLQLQKDGEKISVKKLFKLEPAVFGATQQTPIYFDGHIFGIRPDGQFVCLTPDGKTAWASGPNARYGLGPFMLASGLFFVMNDSGRLSMLEATTSKFNLLAEAQVLKGRESWGPMALAGGRLIVRDLNKMACLDVGKK